MMFGDSVNGAIQTADSYGDALAIVWQLQRLEKYNDVAIWRDGVVVKSWVRAGDVWHADTDEAPIEQPQDDHEVYNATTDTFRTVKV